MSQLYEKPLVYIPTDLVGNAVVDQIRKSFNLQTVSATDTTLGKLLFGGESKIQFSLIEKHFDKKVYRFEIKDYTDAEKIKQLLKEISDGLSEAQKKGENVGLGLFLVALVGAGVAATKLVGEPIFNKDLFFDTSFRSGEIMDKSFLLPSDATEQEKNTAKIGIDGLYYFYKIRSYFTKYISNDPFSRFVGNTSINSDLVPSFYKMIESSYYEGHGRSLRPSPTRKNLSYSISESKSLNHMAFFDLETYNTFLEGCQNLADNKLKSAAQFKRMPDLQYPEQRQKVSKLTQLPDLLPFYVKTEFVTEKTTFKGFSFSSFLNSPQIKPFFEQFLGLYVDLSQNPNKYNGKSWLDSQENFTIFDALSGKEEGSFDARVIKATELLKDTGFLNFQMEKDSSASGCSNIQKKISSLLFSKKIKELIVDTLGDSQDFWVNPNYSETVCYRITKTDKFSGKVSHWFVPNFPSLQNVQIFDTNVRFNRGADATYEVFALKATVAVDYEYKVSPDKATAAALIKKPVEYITKKIISTPYGGTDDNPKPDLFFSVEARPSVNFIEVPFFSGKNVIIYDSAPARPSLGVYTYRSVDDKITVLFGGYVDQYKAKRTPILLDEGVINEKASQYGRQFYSFAKDELYYKTEMEDADVFQLFVLEEPPKAYADFKSGKIIEIKNTSDPILLEELKANKKPYGSSYTFDIQPNKNYWVMGRVVDFNGNVSNPSDVTKINITNDEGYINPLIEWYDMEKERLPKEADSAPDFRQLVSISPALKHTVIQPVASGVSVGGGDEAPYGKSYKIRIKSKKTNKKFDLNVYFKNEVTHITSIKELPRGYKFESTDLDSADAFYPDDFLYAEEEKTKT